MSEYCVVVAAGASARLFTLEPAEVPELESGPNLVEKKTLANPEHRAHEGDIWTDTRRGTNQAKGGEGPGKTAHYAAGEAHNYDEHRDGHEQQKDRMFSRDITKELNELINKEGVEHIVLCAEPQFLGVLRPMIHDKLRAQVDLKEVDKDLVKLSPRQLHERLSADGYLPERERRIPPSG